MATYYSTYSNNFRLRLELTQVSTDISANTSNVSYAFYLENGGAYFQQYRSFGNLTLNGVSVYSLDSQFSLAGPNRSTLLASGNRTIAHNADGTKTMAFSGYFETNTKSSYTPASRLSLSGNFELTTIPRKSTPTLNVSTQALGSSVTISTNRASTSFTHTLTYKIGSQTGTIATEVGASQAWTLPAGLANGIPNATSGTVVITCTTYNGSTNLGSSTVNLTVTVPNTTTFRPTATIDSIVQGTTLPTGITVFVQNKSKVKVTSSGTGKYSSTIKTYSVAVAGIGTYTGSEITSAFLRNSGSVRVTLTVTDSRGLKGSTYQDINVVAYSPPQIPTFSARRSESTPANILVSYNASISSVSNQNGVHYRIRSLASGGSWVVNKNVTTGYTSSESFSISSDTDKSYTIEIYVADSFTSVTQTVQVGTAFTPLDFNASGKGMAIGKVSESDTFEVAIPTNFTGNANFENALTVKKNINFVINQELNLDNVTAIANDGNAWNKYDYRHLFIQNANNALHIMVDGITNSRTAWIQVGHNNPAYANVLGTLKLNPLGGPVTVNNHPIWHSGNSDAMTDSGSNSNGTYVRFSDGTMIQRGTITVNLDITNSQGSAFYGSSTTDFIVFPTTFINDNYSISTDETSPLIIWKAVRGFTYSKEKHRYRNFTYFRATSANEVTIDVDWLAIGRWK